MVRIYLVRQMLSYIYCYFCLLIGYADSRAYTWYGKCFHIYTATFDYLLVRIYLVQQMLSYIYCYFCLLIGGHILGTANAFIYILLLLFTFVGTDCYFCTHWYAYTWYGKCLYFQILSYIYCYFCLLICTILGTANAFIYILHILGTANAFIYILLLLFTDWYAYTWYGKCFHIYTATFVY